jgi:LPS O-antigen subunit length determinant protein (WzzB/FepE family)
MIRLFLYNDELRHWKIIEFYQELTKFHKWFINADKTLDGADVKPFDFDQAPIVQYANDSVRKFIEKLSDKLGNNKLRALKKEVAIEISSDVGVK